MWSGSENSVSEPAVAALRTRQPPGSAALGLLDGDGVARGGLQACLFDLGVTDELQPGDVDGELGEHIASALATQPASCTKALATEVTHRWHHTE